jgi:hypothetical protein
MLFKLSGKPTLQLRFYSFKNTELTIVTFSEHVVKQSVSNKLSGILEDSVVLFVTVFFN